jgi:hypothetical protein
LDAKKSSTGFWSLSGSGTELLCQLRGMAGAPSIQMIRQIVSSSNVSKLAKFQPTPNRLGLTFSGVQDPCPVSERYIDPLLT